MCAPCYLNSGPHSSHHGLRSRQCNGQGGQPHGTTGGITALLRQQDHSSSSQSNSRHSIQHEGHQRCLVFGKLSEPHNQHQHQHHQLHHYYSEAGGVGASVVSNGSSSIRWIAARNHLINACLPALSAPPSLEIYESLTRFQSYRRSTDGCNKDPSFTDTKI